MIMYNYKYKVFRDNIHGYIKVPLTIVDKLIDTEIFQRLRHIEQTGMRVLYPSARHDRFIHSLGTFHLGSKAFQAFKQNIQTYYSSYYEKVMQEDMGGILFWEKSELLFSIACLLHDCAHAPFSHTLEYIYDFKDKDTLGSGALYNKLIQCVSKSEFESDYTNNGAPHECMSAIIVRDYFGGRIKEIIIEFFQKYLGHMKDQGMNNEQADRELKIYEEALDNDVELIMRMIVGCIFVNPKENDLVRQFNNCFISMLKSELMDVDGLDYIIRDSKLAGIDNFTVDVDRLLNSLTVAEVSEFRGEAVMNLELEDTAILDAELHGTFNVKIIGPVKKLKDFHGEIAGNVEITGEGQFEGIHSFHITDDGLFKCNDWCFTKEHKNFTLPIGCKDFSLKAKIDSASFKYTGEMVFGNQFNGRVKTLKQCTMKINGARIEGQISGTFSGVILGKCGGKQPKLVLAFHKNSLSVIQNVVLARNYEYHWIYGHHKVAYYSNYLIRHLFKKSAELIAKRCPKKYEILADDLMVKILSDESFKRPVNLTEITTDGTIQKLSYFTFYLPNDGDILNFIKQAYFINESNPAGLDADFSCLYHELSNRRFKRSVWKSYAEYNLIFSELTIEEKNTLYRFLETETGKQKEKNGKNRDPLIEYGSLPEEWEVELKKYGLEDIVWVKGSAKLKTVDADKTFILLKEKPMRFKDVVTLDETSLNERNLKFFYLYYNGNRIQKEDLKAISKFLTDKAKSISPDASVATR